jgi:hypothetical protein
MGYLYYAPIPPALVVIIALYLLFTGMVTLWHYPTALVTLTTNSSHSILFCLGSGESFNVGRYLEEVNPYMWAMTGIGFAVGLSVLGAGW